MAMGMVFGLVVGCGREPVSSVGPIEVEPEQVVEALKAGDVHQLEVWAQAGALHQELLSNREALEAAVRSGEPRALRRVLEVKQNAGELNDVLGIAVNQGLAAMVPLLVEAGAQARVWWEGAPLLAWALAARSQETVQALVTAGVEVNEVLPSPAPERLVQAMEDERLAYYLRREREVTPLMVASSTGQLGAVRILLEAGAMRNAKTARHRTTAIWMAGKNQHVEVVQLLLGKDPSPEAQIRRIEISLSQQRATLIEAGNRVLESPISSGKKGFATPKGRFVVTNKYRDWKSTLYEGAPMPFFMRLSCSDFGLHAGRLPGYPASHGCIRLPRDKAVAFFERTEVGTLVEIVD